MGLLLQLLHYAYCICCSNCFFDQVIVTVVSIFGFDSIMIARDEEDKFVKYV
jgi:hypothetical protein